jgi:hypothetical protein
VAGPIGALLCLLLTPVQSRVWNGVDSPALVRAVDPFVALVLRLREGVAPGVDDYHFFGRFFVLVYLLALAGIWAFHTGREVIEPRARTWFRVLALALAAGAVADMGPYWGGIDSPFAALFVLEELALVAILIGTVMYGRAMITAGSAPRWLGWTFVAAAPAAPVVTWFSGYFPHGPMLPFTVAVAVADTWLLASRQWPALARS